ncbi:MAG TPA: response regulator transcription factor [Streptosporangiaceae bacterium]
MIPAHPDESPRRILVVDDEPLIRETLVRALESAGYPTDSAADGAAGLRAALTGRYDLVILDLMLPGPDGRAVLTKLRQERPDKPVLVMSCMADVTTKVDLLDLGAEDFLAKPFALDELLARVRVQLRGEHQSSETLRVGHLVLDVARLQADAGVGPVPLTRLEFLLLRELMEHHGDSVAKGKLLATVWGIDFDPGSNVVDVCVRRLRSKLGFDLIETVRGAGYRLAS